ncbi:hypothetical protein KCP74_23780 [Salmonella enterica subsp. enterica]|nr:hypothetical protein KCP74_23780 [Salmonella enterica subsp. enterica]
MTKDRVTNALLMAVWRHVAGLAERLLKPHGLESRNEPSWQLSLTMPVAESFSSY